MKIQSSQLLQSTCLALAIAAAASPATAETAQDVLEARQETQIWTTYALSPYLRANNIQVSVDQGVATLTGTVQEKVNKDLARHMAMGVEGIDKVDDQIEVSADFLPAAPDPDKRMYGEVIDDASITMAVKSKLLWNKYTDGLAINVETRSGKVTLLGSADSAITRELAATLARNTHGVTRVNNELIIANPAPNLGDNLAESGVAAGQKISDSWITTKVKSTFIYSNNVTSADISVSTLDGIVSLSGKLGSGAEQALAIEMAQNIRGVRQVEASGLTF